NLRRPEYLDFVFSQIPSGWLGFCYDAGHENCYTQGADLLSRYGSKLMALHLHDNDGSGDQHRIPGDGTIDWQALQAGLKRSGYPGAIALEVIHENGDPETAESYLKRALDSARQLFGEFNS
ncbi:MAG TPA: xylose isomerase, partial [Firmicutes bacterium]|nr:xylose isomerase [Bacillota bacterium]